MAIVLQLTTFKSTVMRRKGANKALLYIYVIDESLVEYKSSLHS